MRRAKTYDYRSFCIQHHCWHRRRAKIKWIKKNFKCFSIVAAWIFKQCLSACSAHWRRAIFLFSKYSAWKKWLRGFCKIINFNKAFFVSFHFVFFFISSTCHAWGRLLYSTLLFFFLSRYVCRFVLCALNRKHMCQCQKRGACELNKMVIESTRRTTKMLSLHYELFILKSA